MPDKEQLSHEFESDKLLLRVQRIIPCDVGAIAPLVEDILRVTSQIGCAVGKELEVETGLREALANAIVHGCKGDRNQEIEVFVSCDESRGMLIVIRHPGEGFDPTAIPSPVLGQNIFSSHGRGIYLINLLMDEVRYERGGTEIVMRKR